MRKIKKNIWKNKKFNEIRKKEGTELKSNLAELNNYYCSFIIIYLHFGVNLTTKRTLPKEIKKQLYKLA